jgi:hypothetical protein
VESHWKLDECGEHATLETDIGLICYLARENIEGVERGYWYLSCAGIETYLPSRLTYEQARVEAWLRVRTYLKNWLKNQPAEIPAHKPEKPPVPAYDFEPYDYHGCTLWGNHRRTTARPPVPFTDHGIFWNSQHNTYVLVKPPPDMSEWQKDHLLWSKGVALCSINGGGEIRWDVTPKSKIEYYEAGDLEAIKYFGLISEEGKTNEDD